MHWQMYQGVDLPGDLPISAQKVKSEIAIQIHWQIYLGGRDLPVDLPMSAQTVKLEIAIQIHW